MQHAQIESRSDLRVPARDHNLDLDPFAPIRVLDLDRGGVVVETETWLAPGGRYPLCLGPNIHLTGVVVRSSLRFVRETYRGPRRVYRTGIRFDPPSDEARDQLRELMASLTRLGPAEPMPTMLLFG